MFKAGKRSLKRCCLCQFLIKRLNYQGFLKGVQGEYHMIIMAFANNSTEVANNFSILKMKMELG